MNISVPIKVGVCSLAAFLFVTLAGFVGFPKMIKTKIKKMVNLSPGTEIREMFLDLPFPLKFNVYIFNVTNPTEIQTGAKPELMEVGPFCYDEWKVKVNVTDNEINDTISYFPMDTYKKRKESNCTPGNIKLTIPHPLILGSINTVKRIKPGALSLLNKATKSIFKNPKSIFVTASADDILFNGIEIDCNVTDFAGKATCVEFRALGTLQERSGNILAISLLGQKNATLQNKIKALRGSKSYYNVGKIVEYNNSGELNIWGTKECDAIKGTDGTIFPPMSKREEALTNFSPDLCRSLTPIWVKKTKYKNIPADKYTISLGDMSQNEAEKCYCYTPDSCLKKGLMDLFNCNGIPIYASMPHFYDSDISYIEGVKGLSPNEDKHAVSILFESMTGTPLQVRKRLQFSMPLEGNPKVDLLKNVSNSVIPIFWIEENLDLNKTYTKPIKMLYTMKKVVNILSSLVMITSLVALAAAGYLFSKNADLLHLIKVKKANGSDNSKSVEN